MAAGGSSLPECAAHRRQGRRPRLVGRCRRALVRALERDRRLRPCTRAGRRDDQARSGGRVAAGVALGLASRGKALRRQGRAGEGRVLLEEAVALSLGRRDLPGAGSAAAELGLLLLDDGDIDAAGRLLASVERDFAATRMRVYTVGALHVAAASCALRRLGQAGGMSSPVLLGARGEPRRARCARRGAMASRCRGPSEFAARSPASRAAGPRRNGIGGAPWTWPNTMARRSSWRLSGANSLPIHPRRRSPQSWPIRPSLAQARGCRYAAAVSVKRGRQSSGARRMCVNTVPSATSASISAVAVAGLGQHLAIGRAEAPAACGAALPAYATSGSR